MPARRDAVKTATADTAAIDYPNVLKRMQEILGVRRLLTDQDVMILVEERLPSQAIEALRESGVADEELYTLIVPRRTLTHRRERGEALSREESDRAVRVARVV